jgi:cytochrome c biogenesis protein CcmG, thiol:disulfide interchange protein DsbE
MRSLTVSLLVALVFSTAMQGTAQQPSLIGSQAPRFVRPDLKGRRIDLDDYRDKVVLLNFWATWCAPCRVELPTFSSWQGRYGPEGLQVIAVAMDDDSAPVGKAARKLHLNFPVLMGDEKLGDDYGRVLGLPVTYLIGRNGKITARFAGETDLDQVESKVRELLLER